MDLVRHGFKGKPRRLYYGKSGVVPGSGAGKAWVVGRLRVVTVEGPDSTLESVFWMRP